MTSLSPPLTISTLSRPSVSTSRNSMSARHSLVQRERETHSLTHRVKDWDLVMCVAGRRGGGREGTRDTLTHSQGQGLGPSDVCGREEGRRERGNERHTHSQGQGLGPSDVCGREEGRRERGNERLTHSLTGSRIGT